MSNYEHSVFKERKVNTFDFKEDKVSKDRLKAAIGDYAQFDLLNTKEMNADQIFADEVQEIMPTKKTLTSRIKNAFSGIFHKKSIGKMEQGKRVERAKEKILLQNHMISERKLLKKRREEDLNYLNEVVGEEQLELIKEKYTTPEAKEALRNWSVINKLNRYGHDSDLIDKSLVSKDKYAYKYDLPLILGDVNAAKVEDFEYTSDNEFVSNFASKYDQICRYASADFFYKEFYKLESNHNINKVSIVDVRAKIDFFKQLKEDYEDRMKLISSPYYALLAKSDMDRYMKKNGESLIDNEIQDEKLRDYIRLFRKVSNNPLQMKKNNYMNFYNNALNTARTERKNKDVILWEQNRSKLKELEDIKMEECEQNKYYFEDKPYYTEEDSKMREVFLKDRLLRKKSYSKDNREFVNSVMLTSQGGKLLGFEDDDIQKYENIFLDVIENGEIYGKKIAPEHQGILRETIINLMESRRDYAASGWSMSYCYKIYLGSEYDYNNELFKVTEEGKELAEFMKASNTMNDVQNSYNETKVAYGEIFIKIYKLLGEFGYPLSKDMKYEKRMDEQVEEGLEYFRKRIEENYYSGHPVKDGEERKRKELPRTKVNNKEYIVLDDYDILDKMAGKSYNFDEKTAKYFDEYANICKKLAAGYYLLALDGGEKSLVYYGMQERLRSRREFLSAEINKVIDGKLDSFEQK